MVVLVGGKLWTTMMVDVEAGGDEVKVAPLAVDVIGEADEVTVITEESEPPEIVLVIV